MCFVGSVFVVFCLCCGFVVGGFFVEWSKGSFYVVFLFGFKMDGSGDWEVVLGEYVVFCLFVFGVVGMVVEFGGFLLLLGSEFLFLVDV